MTIKMVHFQIGHLVSKLFDNFLTFPVRSQPKKQIIIIYIFIQDKHEVLFSTFWSWSGAFKSCSPQDKRWSIEYEQTFALGRNDFTGLSDVSCPHFQFVSRNHIAIIVRRDKIFMRCTSRQAGLVYLNRLAGTTKLNSKKPTVSACLAAFSATTMFCNATRVKVLNWDPKV